MEIKPLDANISGADLMTLSQDDAQAFMDELWGAGLRPTAEGSAGQLRATEKHLEDMRQNFKEAQAMILRIVQLQTTTTTIIK